MTFPFGKVPQDRSRQKEWVGRLVSLTAGGLLILAWASIRAGAQTPVGGPSRRVLVLYSDERLLPANVIVDEAIHATFAADTSKHIELYSEFLDVARFPAEEQRQRHREFFRERYRERSPDLVIAVGGDAFAFVTERRAELFAGVPIVYCSVAGDPHPRDRIDARIADVPVPATADRTLEMMLRLHPDTRGIAVVSGSGPRDLKYAEVFREALPAFGNRVAITWLSNRSVKELRGELSRLPDHTVVLYLTMFQDAAGEVFLPRRALEVFSPASRAPIYGYYETFLGHGIVGGSIVPFAEIGRKAAKLSLRILGGEEPRAAARSESYQPVPMFDWRELRRWNISERQLPPGSVVLFKQATYWEQHRRVIVTAVSLCLLEALLIAALLTQLRRRRLAEASLRENEQRMSLALDSANFGIWIRDLARNEIWASDKWRQLFGFAPSELLHLENILERVHPDDREAVRQLFEHSLAGGGNYDAEFRVILPNGKIRWISSNGRAECDASGRPVFLRGASRDSTARKQAEQETLLLRQEVAHVSRVSMMGQLASALAHEINQPLGAILRNAEAAELFLQNPSPDLDEIRAIVADIRKDDQRAGSVIDRMRGLLKRQNLETRPLELSELVSEVLALVRTDAAARQVKLEVNVPRSLPPVRGDRVHLQQVLLNLILNGMDALNGADRPDRRVSVNAFPGPPRTVEITVTDTGNGIPPDRLAHVFEPFFTTKPNGMGMGLPISRTIVEAHGGRIWAETHNSGGTAFHFTVPVAGGC